MALDINKMLLNKGALKEVIGQFKELHKQIKAVAKSGEEEGRSFSSRQKKEVTAYAKAIDELLKKYKSIEKTIVELTSDYKKLTKSTAAATKAALAKKNMTIDEKEALKELNKEERINARVRNANAGTIEHTRAKLAQVTMQWAKLTKVEGFNSASTKKLAADKTKLNKVLRELEGRTGDARRNVGNYGGALGKLKNSIVSVTQAAGVFFGIMGLVRLFKNYISIIRDFEKTAATLSAVLRIAKDEMRGLTDEAIRLGSITVKTAQEILKLELVYARLGFTIREILALTEDTINGSIALNAALDDTAALAGAMVKTFREFDVNDVGEILDKLSLATTKSALDFDKLQKALPIVGGAANAAGVSFTRLLALLSKLADAGIDTSTSATAIRNIFIRAADAGEDWNEILLRISESQDQLTASADAFGVRASVSASVLSEQLDSVEALDKAYRSFQGVSKEMADKELRTLDGAIQLVNSAWQGMILRSNEANDIIGKITDVMKWLAINIENLVGVIIDLIFYWVVWKTTIIATTTIIGLINAKVKISLVLFTLQRLALNKTRIALLRFIVAFRALNVTMQANIFGVIIVGLFLLYDALSGAGDEVEELVEELTEYQKAQKEIIDNHTTELEQLNELNRLIRESKDLIYLRQKAIEDFNEKYDETLTLEEGEIALLAQLKIAYGKIKEDIEDRSYEGHLKTLLRSLKIEKKALEDSQLAIETRKDDGKTSSWEKLADARLFKQNTLELTRVTQQVEGLKVLLDDLYDDPEKIKATLTEDDYKFLLKTSALRIKDRESAIVHEKFRFRVAKMFGDKTVYAAEFRQEKHIDNLKKITEKYDDEDAKKQKVINDRHKAVNDVVLLVKEEEMEIERRNAEARQKIIEVQAKTEDEVLDARKSRYELDVSNKELTEDEKELLWYEYQQDITDIEEKFETERERKRLARFRKQLADQKRSVDMIGKELQRLADLRVTETERAVDKAQSALEIQNQRAVAGLENTLAEQQKLLAKSEKERAEATRRQQRVEKARALYSAYAGYAQAGDPEMAIVKTLKDFAILEAISAVFSFGKGGIVDEKAPKSGVLSGDSHKANSGGIHILAEGSEGILSVNAMRNLGRENFHTIMNMAERGKIDDNMFSKQLSQHTSVIVEPGLREEMIKTRRAIEAKKEISAPEIVDGMINIIEKTKRGSMVTRNNYRTRKPRF